MATAFVVEFDEQGKATGGHRLEVPQYPAITRQAVTFTTSAQSATLNGRTTYVGMIADAKAHFAVALDPTATANNEYIPADSWHFISVVPGSGYKIAFYDGTS